MVKLKNHHYEASASNVAFREELLKVQKNLETGLEKVKASLECAVEMTKEWDAVRFTYEELRLSVRFASKEIARLETEIVKVMQELNASVAKTE